MSSYTSPTATLTTTTLAPSLSPRDSVNMVNISFALDFSLVSANTPAFVGAVRKAVHGVGVPAWVTVSITVYAGSTVASIQLSNTSFVSLLRASCEKGGSSKGSGAQSTASTTSPGQSHGPMDFSITFMNMTVTGLCIGSTMAGGNNNAGDTSASTGTGVGSSSGSLLGAVAGGVGGGLGLALVVVVVLLVRRRREYKKEDSNSQDQARHRNRLQAREEAVGKYAANEGEKMLFDNPLFTRTAVNQDLGWMQRGISSYNPSETGHGLQHKSQYKRWLGEDNRSMDWDWRAGRLAPAYYHGVLERAQVESRLTAGAGEGEGDFLVWKDAGTGRFSVSVVAAGERVRHHAIVRKGPSYYSVLQCQEPSVHALIQHLVDRGLVGQPLSAGRVLSRVGISDTFESLYVKDSAGRHKNEHRHSKRGGDRNAVGNSNGPDALKRFGLPPNQAVIERDQKDPGGSGYREEYVPLFCRESLVPRGLIVFKRNGGDFKQCTEGLGGPSLMVSGGNTGAAKSKINELDLDLLYARVRDMIQLSATALHCMYGGEVPEGNDQPPCYMDPVVQEAAVATHGYGRCQ